MVHYRSQPIIVLAHLDALFPLVHAHELPLQLADFPNDLHAIVSIRKPSKGLTLQQPRPCMMRGLSDDELRQCINEPIVHTTLWKDGIGLKLWADGTLRTDNDDVLFAIHPDMVLQPESTVAFPFLEPILPWTLFCLVVEYV